MSKKKNPAIMYFLIILLYSCSNNDPVISRETNELAETITMKSKAISKNKIDDKGIRKIRIDLPPDYLTSDKRYPVIYYFHGYGGVEQEFAKSGIIKMLHEQFSSNQLNQFILVSINGNNKFGGSFYVNSKMTGNWEDHFINEIIPMIDGLYRTIPKKSSRALAGFSMGGFGVLHIGLKYSQYFSGIWALCPGVFDKENGLEDALQTWNDWESVKQAYGAAFANDSENFPDPKPNPGDTHYDKWQAGYGGWNNRIINYKNSNSLLKIRIAIGKYDSYKWINEGSKYLQMKLEKNNINSEIREYKIGHQLSEKAFKEDAIPFFNSCLAF